MTDLFGAASDKCTEKLNKSKHQEMRDTFEIMKIERKKYLEKKVILHTLNKCLSESSELSDDLKNKIQSIIQAAEVKPCMALKTKYSEENLLGLSDMHTVDLLYAEQEKLNEEFYNKFKLIEDEFPQTSSKLMQMTDDTDLFQLNRNDKNLLNTKEQLTTVQEAYVENLKIMYQLLEELLHLRFQNVKHLVENKINEYSIKSKMYNLRSEMIKEKTRVDIFNETSLSFVAYEKFLSDIIDQQNECQKEIDDLVELQEKYKSVECKEYDEILKSYIQYKDALERKKDLYKQLKNKCEHP